MSPKFQGQEMLPFQPTSESCLIGCYNSEGVEAETLSRQVRNPHAWSVSASL